MIDFYAKLVLAGKMTIDQVPPKYQEAVRKRIEELARLAREERND